MLQRGATISVITAAIALAGCTPTPDPARPPPADALLDPAQPAIMGATNGLEMRVWVTQDQDDVLAEAVQRYEARPTPMLDSTRRAWRASGLRVIAIPTDELGELRDQLRVIAPEQRDWFGQSPDWSEAVRGREVRAGTAIEVADGVMKSPAGRLRMLMRCWTSPGETLTDPAMHLELAVQLERRDTVSSPLDLPALASELEAGVVFPRLRTTMRVPADTALVILPMPERVEPILAFDPPPHDLLPPSPGPMTDESAEPAEPGDETIATGPDNASPAVPEGPPVPLTPTLGEAMLTSAVPGAIEPVRRRAVIVLLPRLPERFRLSNADRLSRSAASAPPRR